MTNIYYIYAWYFTGSDHVFYIGKGKGRRYKDIKSRNSKFKNFIAKCDCSVKKLYENLEEDEAYKKEIETIAFYKNINQCECNFTIDGDAPPKHFGKECPIHKSVVQLDLKGNYIKTWDYICEVEKVLGINNSAIVR